MVDASLGIIMGPGMDTARPNVETPLNRTECNVEFKNYLSSAMCLADSSLWTLSALSPDIDYYQSQNGNDGWNQKCAENGTHLSQRID